MAIIKMFLLRNSNDLGLPHNLYQLHRLGYLLGLHHPKLGMADLKVSYHLDSTHPSSKPFLQLGVHLLDLALRQDLVPLLQVFRQDCPLASSNNLTTVGPDKQQLPTVLRQEIITARPNQAL